MSVNYPPISGKDYDGHLGWWSLRKRFNDNENWSEYFPRNDQILRLDGSSEIISDSVKQILILILVDSTLASIVS